MLKQSDEQIALKYLKKFENKWSKLLI